MPHQLAQLMRPFEDFFKRQASGGLVLLGTTIIALILANSPWSQSYYHFWETDVTLGAEAFGLTMSLHHWINDGLMAVFFFVVGLEIKREFLAGELAEAGRAALPIVAALGGMLIPALIFFLINPSAPAVHGWGIPMATDIAFALGIIALLGNRINRSLAIFLTALAIVDDLGAVVVIAMFFTSELNLFALGLGVLFLGILIVGNQLDIQHPVFYTLVGLALWVFLLKSGVHASLAGVLIGATIPVRPRHSYKDFVQRAELLLDRYKGMDRTPGPFHHEAKLGTLLALEHVCHDAMSPLQRMEHEMNLWVIFGVMPVFALSNAGISLNLADLGASFTNPVTYGVALGLLLGKPLGIMMFTWLAVRSGLASLPQGVRWKEVMGISMLGGIGFTMSIFITNLAYQDGLLINSAKSGILAASLLAGGIGFVYLARLHNKR